MNNRYKLSNYNFVAINDYNEILLYNSYIGTPSLLKGDLNIWGKYFIEKKDNINNLPKKYLDILMEKGLIIAENDNESEKLKLLYLKTLNNPELHLIILPTGQCNFRCKYCYESFEDGAMSQEVQDSIIRFISKNISRYSSVSVGWFGGEPLVGLSAMKYLSENLIRLCRKHHKPYTSSIVTNGYLLDYEMLKQLKKWNITTIQITIDGLAKTHDSQKPLVNGGKTFDKIINNLLEIKEKEKSKLFRFLIRTNVSKEVLNSMEDYFLFFSNNFGDDNRFSYFLRPVMDLGGERVECFKSEMIHESTLKRAYEIIQEHANIKFPLAYDMFLNPGSGVCYASQMNSFVVNPYGHLKKCTCNLDNCDENDIGQINSDGTAIIDESKYSAWLGIANCSEECFFAPNCVREACPAPRVINKYNCKSCPHEKENLADVLRVLDSQNNIFERLEWNDAN